MPYAAAAGGAAVRKYHEEECIAALAVAEAELRQAGVDFQSSWVVGEPGPEIAGYAAKNAIDLIVMGSHGHGTLRTLALGSTTDQVMRAATQPVLVVK